MTPCFILSTCTWEGQGRADPTDDPKAKKRAHNHAYNLKRDQKEKYRRYKEKNKEKIRTPEQIDRMREYSRSWEARQRLRMAADPVYAEEVRAKRRAKQARLSPETRERNQHAKREANMTAEQIARKRLRARIWNQAHPRKRSRLKSTTATPIEVIGVALRRSLLVDPLYSIIAKAVPVTLPRDVRDDIVSALYLEVLEGRITPSEAATNVKAFISAHYRNRDWHRSISLSGPVRGTEDLCLMDMLDSEVEHV